MSSKKRASTRTTTTTRESNIHVDTTRDDTESDSTNTSNWSPNTSTNRWNRQQEKAQLSHLNDRLATYIEKVRSLETENASLKVQIRDVEVVEKKEKESLAGRYESKINDLRKQLDALTRQSAKLEIDRAKAVDGHDDLKARNSKLDKDLKAAELRLKNAYHDVQDLTARHNNANNARDIAEKENDALKKEVEDLRTQLDVLRQQLEDEVVLRTELENKLATYKEDLEFSRRSHSNQMEEFRRKRQVEMTSFSTEVENRYQIKLQEQLQAMRADFDARIAQSRAEVDELYKSKLSEASDQASRNRATAADAREEASRYRLLIHDLETQVAGHDAKVAALTRKIADLENAYRRLQDDMEERIQQKDEEIANLQNDAAAMINEYRDLMDLKVQLDTELQAYQKLLESEETRLQITPMASPNVSQQSHHVSFADSLPGVIQSTIRRGTKRKRLDQEDFVDFDQSSKTWKSSSNSDVDVIIDEVDTEGGFIRLKNQGEDDMSIGAWYVRSTADDKEVKFKFHSRQAIKAGKSITIWSNNSGQEHNPPHNIVMKNQKWPVADAIRVELLNDEQEVVAWREAIFEHGYYRAENGSDPDQRCNVM
ncbi:intermediate filament protein domain-containing protein [Ditylenchus destructor]|uniref:Intermediate filament protein domain-containing protein n=1 Tax=Ditylenchus destructor TaxID=166010 RepID=A0AAD4NDH4_9BILA|nr:intermediate filament protein domain-containing protein [Ditylenchus destructor]